MTTSPSAGEPSTDRHPDDPTARPSGGPWPAVAAVVALLAMAPVGFFYAASGLLVPGPWLFLMWLLYAVLLGLAVWLARRRSYLVLAVPVVAGGLWFGIISAGEAWLGWTG